MISDNKMASDENCHVPEPQNLPHREIFHKPFLNFFWFS